jgi:hypothetical protein
MVVAKKLRAVLAGTILLIIIASLAAFLSAPRQTTLAAQTVAPGIEEHHYITVTVKAPDNTTQTHTYETKSFVYTEVLMIRMFSAWIENSNIAASKMLLPRAVVLLNKSGYISSLLTGYIPDDYVVYSEPSLVFLGSGTSNDGGKTLGSPLGVSAVPSVSYIYNDQWFNVTITATFSFSDPVTVSEAMLAAQTYNSYFAAVIYDSFPAVNVPAGGSLTVQWVLAWKDYGAFTENWGKLWQYALTLDVGPHYSPHLNFTDDTGTVTSVRWPNIYSGDIVIMMRLAWGTGTSPMSRSSYKLQLERGSAQTSYTLIDNAMSIGGTVGSQASEVGLYWLATDDSGVLHRILLMRWVPGYTLPAGTPVNIYIAKGG